MNVIAMIARQYMDDNHMWRDDGRMWLWGGFMMLCVLVVVVGLIVWLAVRASQSQQHCASHDVAGVRAREILAERYARGEISTEEYQERLTVLR